MSLGRYLPALAVIILLAGIPAIPAAANENEAPEAYLERALALLKANHINRDNADWTALGDAARTLIINAETPRDTHAAIRAVIVSLDEKHTYLLPPRPPQQRSGTASSSTKQPSPPMPKGELLADDIGYVTLPPLSTVQGREAVGVQYRTTLQTLLEELDTSASCGWIVDLRKNYGGNMWPMLNGLDPLLGDGPFGYFVGQDKRDAWARTDDGITVLQEPTQSRISPAFSLKNGKAPIAVLLGEKTTSSGEMVAVALIGLSNTKSFGRPTANFTTAVVPYELSDGAILGVTTSKIAFASGEVIDGALQPDVVLAEEDAQDEAVRWLKGECMM